MFLCGMLIPCRTAVGAGQRGLVLGAAFVSWLMEDESELPQGKQEALPSSRVMEDGRRDLCRLT